jgi:hypothetical protein
MVLILVMLKDEEKHENRQRRICAVRILGVDADVRAPVRSGVHTQASRTKSSPTHFSRASRLLMIAQ